MQVEYNKPHWSDRFLLLDMLEGLKTTLRELFKPKVTIRYPEERMEPADRFRGMFKFSYDRCIACKLCAVACPIDIIYIDVHDDMIEEGGKKKKVKVLDRYDIDVKQPTGHLVVGHRGLHQCRHRLIDRHVDLLPQPARGPLGERGRRNVDLVVRHLLPDGTV